MARILVCGLNPAWQTVLTLPYWTPGAVIRATDSHTLASGKGMNAARVLSRLGHDVVLVQCLAGERGRQCLAACEKAGIRSIHAWGEGETRQCLTLRDDATGVVTEVISPFAVDYQEKWRDGIFQAIQDAGHFDAFILLGSAPNGWSPVFYRDLIPFVQADIKIVDAIQGLSASDLLRAQWLKINAEEWLAWEKKETISVSPGASQMNLLITDGPRPARLRLKENQSYRLTVPEIQVVNPIGAGDTVTAGLAHFLLAGMEPKWAGVQALAMGAASCLDILPAHFDAQAARDLADGIEVRTWN